MLILFLILDLLVYSIINYARVGYWYFKLIEEIIS